MDILIKILQLLLCFSTLVIIHEMGHFLFARLFKMRVEKFYLFFPIGFSLFKLKKGDTEYGIGWLPLGGYVKISGMVDESFDMEQMKGEPQPWEFRSKPAWQRLLIMSGGVLMNVVFAFMVYIFALYTWGKSYLPMESVKNGVVCDTVFKAFGVHNGDLIVALDTNEVKSFYSIVPDILLNNPKKMTVMRGGERIELDIPSHLKAALLNMASSQEGRLAIQPRLQMDSLYINQFAAYSVAYDAGIRSRDRIWRINGKHPGFYDQFVEMLDTLSGSRLDVEILRGADTLSFPVKLGNDGKMGISFASTESFKYETIQYTFLEAIPAGIARGSESITSYIKQLGLLFTRGTKSYKSVGGILTIGNAFPGYWDWSVFWDLTAIISIMLAIVNILPIPMLDGGHILFLLYEILSRRKPSVKFMERAQLIGMIIIVLLFLLATTNDISRLF